MNDQTELAKWQRWRQARHDELAAPDSWLGLVGLFWLEEGRNPVGSAAEATVVLPAGPATLGEIVLQHGTLSWQSADDDALLVDEALPAAKSGIGSKFLEVNLRSDADGAPTVLGVGALRFFVIERDGRFAVRVKNREWALAQPYFGIETFPYAAEWVIDADWQALATPQTIEVPSVTGELKPVEITHRAVFEHAGRTFALLPLSNDGQAVFFVFRDQTSGRVSYGGGRFLRAKPPLEGRIRLDFNRAFSPPCAFTPFATCPLPPPENWLPFPIEAGEKRYAEH